METKNRPPTVAELTREGFRVKVTHTRLYKAAWLDHTSRKLVVSTVSYSVSDDNDGVYVLSELLPKGGMTEVTVTCPTTNLDFYASATCHSNENFSRKVGVHKCMERIHDLMRVLDGKEGFKCPVFWWTPED